MERVPERRLEPPPEVEPIEMRWTHGSGCLYEKQCPQMTYTERLMRYEEEKRLLQAMGLDPFEYERLLRKAAEKWRI